MTSGDEAGNKVKLCMLCVQVELMHSREKGDSDHEVCEGTCWVLFFVLLRVYELSPGWLLSVWVYSQEVTVSFRLTGWARRHSTAQHSIGQRQAYQHTLSHSKGLCGILASPPRRLPCPTAVAAASQVLKLTYPYQPALRDWGKETAAAQQSVFAMPAPMFYELHPFHLVMDRQLQLLQWGAAIGRVVPDLQAGQHVRHFFKVIHWSEEGFCGCRLLEAEGFRFGGR